MKQKITFEDAMIQLEEKVRMLEGGNMTLEESLGAFEESIALVKICNDCLTKAEGRVRILTESADGSITDEPFDTDEA